MRRWIRLLAAACFALPAAGIAQDSGLYRAELEIGLQSLPFAVGVPLRFDVPAEGALLETPAGRHYTFHPGSVFATQRCYGGVFSGCTPAAPFAAPVTRVFVEIGANAGLDFWHGDPTISPCCASGAGITGSVRYRAKIGKAPSFTVLRVPLALGAPVTLRSSTHPSPSLVITYLGDAWHLGPVTLTGLTSDRAPLPDVMATGGISARPGGLLAVNLVSLARVRTRGLYDSNTALPARLTLVYGVDGMPLPGQLWFCPEPGGMTLLGAAAGVALVGRRRSRRRER
jgi:hypothetical protein